MTAHDPFIEFLRTGALVGIALGASTADAAAVLGEADESSQLGRGVLLLAYAHRALQLTFSRDRLVLMGIYWRYGNAPRLLGTELPFSKESSQSEVRAKLDDWQVAWRDSQSLPGSLEVGDGSTLLIFAEDALDSIQRS